jgi:hypothetical protein
MEPDEWLWLAGAISAFAGGKPSWRRTTGAALSLVGRQGTREQAEQQSGTSRSIIITMTMTMTMTIIIIVIITILTIITTITTTITMTIATTISLAIHPPRRTARLEACGVLATGMGIKVGCKPRQE